MADLVESSSAYAPLLQPIRDLATSWQIDIEGGLEEFLDELESITFTLGEDLQEAVTDPLSSDDTTGTVNFAQAALLIQGSTLIYSKKVESLLQLVNRHLHVLSSDKSKVPGKAVSRQAAKDAVAEDEAEFAMEKFLTLDNVIKEGKDIDIDQPAYNTRNGSSRRFAKTGPISNHPMMSALLKEDRGSSFRMNSCHVHASGALVIGSSSSGITNALDNLVSPAMAMAMSSMSVSQKSMISQTQLLQQQVKEVDEVGSLDFANACDDFSCGGHDDYSGQLSVGVSSPVVARSPGSLFGVERSGKGFTGSPPFVDTNESKDLPLQDPWAMLDPHDPSKESTKPIKVGKCYQLPVSLNSTSQTIGQPKTGSLRNRRNLQLQGLHYSEFGYIVVREKKRSMAKRKHERSVLLKNNLAHNNEIEEVVDFGVFGEDADTGYEDNFDACGTDEDDVCREDDHIGYVAPVTLNNAFQLAPKSYADLCREHIESYMRGVNQYTNESQLSQRVGEWQARLTPMLEEQAQRRCFDIREYGHELMGEVIECTNVTKKNNMTKSAKRQSLSGHEVVVPLSSVTAGRASFDVCRMFLASLQLANEGNLLLHHPDNSGDVCGLDELQLQIISEVTSEERFDEYRAPSVATII